MDTKYVLGINFLHSDSSACIFVDNTLLVASEEERFSRIKHTSSFPFNAINFCLNEAKIDIGSLYTKLAKKNELIAYEIQNRFYEIGSEKGIQDLEKYLQRKS